MEKNNGDNKQFGLMRMIIVFLSIIIILLVIVIMLLFNNYNDNNKANNNDNNAKLIEKVDSATEDKKEEIEQSESEKSDDENYNENIISFDNNLKIDKELKNIVKEITIDLGDRKNPLFDIETRENSGSFVELALNMLPTSNLHKYETGEKVPSPAEVGIDLSIDYDPFAGYVEAKPLREKYKEVFCKDLVNSNYMSCPFMVYSSKYDRYYYIYNCGGTGYSFSKYVYDYKFRDNLYLVYIAYESAMGTEEVLGPNNYRDADKYELAFRKNGTSYIFNYSKILN
jgi:competence protein ComGC